MKLFDINSKEISLRPSASGFSKASRSKLQKLTRERLIEKYPHELIYEDFVIPGCRLSVDFLIYRLGLVVEVDGSQHEKFSAFHHGERAISKKFGSQRKNDMLKTKWCEINNFELVRIKAEKDLEKINV